jgi:hypothetical protein
VLLHLLNTLLILLMALYLLCFALRVFHVFGSVYLHMNCVRGAASYSFPLVSVDVDSDLGSQAVWIGVVVPMFRSCMLTSGLK